MWNEGPLTLAQAHERFSRYGRKVEYPTMQTRLNRLVVKGFLKRSDDRPAVYGAAIGRDQIGAGHLAQIVEKVGRGVVVPLVAHLLARGRLAPDEIAELQRLLAEADRPSPPQDTRSRSS